MAFLILRYLFFVFLTLRTDSAENLDDSFPYSAAKAWHLVLSFFFKCTQMTAFLKIMVQHPLIEASIEDRCFIFQFQNFSRKRRTEKVFLQNLNALYLRM